MYPIKQKCAKRINNYTQPLKENNAMAMLPGLQLNVSQQLKLTPQLQQSIKVLQYSAVELQEAIEEALESNVMLTTADDLLNNANHTLSDAHNDTDNLTEDTFDHHNSDIDLFDIASLNSNTSPTFDDISDQHASTLAQSVDYEWETLFDSDGATDTSSDNHSQDAHDYQLSHHHDDDEYTAAENYTAAHEDLYSHLTWQVSTFHWQDDAQQTIAHYLIDAINDHGYLAVDCDDIAEHINHNEPIHVNTTQVIKTLQLIHDNFTPSGVGARTIQECLHIQLRSLIPQTPLTQHATQLIEQHFDLFSQGEHQRLKRQLRWDDAHWQSIIRLIQSCNPKPGLSFANSEQTIIIPDLIVKRDKTGWHISLNSRAYPHVQVNSEYVDLLKLIDKQHKHNEQTEILKEKLIEAKGLIKSIQSRGETLLKVGTYLIKEQRQFLEEGDIAMKPLVLRDAADALGLHESTISRATTQKYIQTPRGTYELKYFFSSSVSQYGPQDQSAVAIKARIKQLIDAEDPKKPVSDQYLVEQLEQMNISVARRTIAKYREALGIPSSSERKIRY